MTALIPELAARVQALEAERLRPVPPPPRPRVIDLEALTELCDALADDEELAGDDGAGSTRHPDEEADCREPGGKKQPASHEAPRN